MSDVSELPPEAAALIDTAAIEAAEAAYAVAVGQRRKAIARREEAEAALAAAQTAEQALDRDDASDTELVAARRAVQDAEVAVQIRTARASELWAPVDEAERARRQVRGDAHDELVRHGIRLRIRAAQTADSGIAIRGGNGFPTAAEKEAGEALLEPAARDWKLGTVCLRWVDEHGRRLPSFNVHFPVTELDERIVWERYPADVHRRVELLKKHNSDPGFAISRASSAVERARRNPQAPIAGLNAKLEIVKRSKDRQHAEKVVILALMLEAEALEWAERDEQAAATD